MECYVSEEDVREQAHPSHDETLLMQETNKLSLNEESEDPNIQPHKDMHSSQIRREVSTDAISTKETVLAPHNKPDMPPHARRVPDSSLFALRRLRRVKEKLNCQAGSASGLSAADGVRQDHTRIRDHVDNMLGQAQGMDILCNVVEGWSPWI